ncbi:MAG: SPOR domain-containing protein [Pseudorhodobacter sp.]|nr:SPOR domain-containing protein [Pseudorhodobacter sp.]
MACGAIRHMVLAAVAAVGLSGCAEGTNPFAAKDPTADDPAQVATPATSVRLVDRDVEAPEVFQVTDAALWDGRPSLGGVWVASPDVVDPERVILRNPANGKFVIGALFRRERDNPGPKLQISSDAAAALDLLAGQPGTINVTALRREEAAASAPDAGQPLLDAAETVPDATPDAAAVAGAAIAAIDATATAPAAPPAPTGGGLTIQIGIFSVEANAKRAADTLTKAGIAAEVRPGQTQGKAFWSVVAKGSGDKAALLAKVKGLGFTDAYFVTG